MGRSHQKNSGTLCTEATRQTFRSVLIKIIRHRPHEVLSPTSVRATTAIARNITFTAGCCSYSDAPISIKEELRVLPGLLAIVKSFIEELAEVEQNSDRKKLAMGGCLKIFRLSPASVKFVEVHNVINRDKLRSDAF